MLSSRRHFVLRSAAFAAGFSGLRRALAAQVRADPLSRGPDGAASPDQPGFGPLKPDPDGILDLPDGFSYQLISRAGERMDDGLIVPGRHDAMAAFPGPDGLTIIVRNHEVEHGDHIGAPESLRKHLLDNVDPAKIYDRGHGKLASAGGTTTLLYDTRADNGRGRLIKHFQSLAGTERNCAGGPTPRGTWISCEETVVNAGTHFEKDHGYCFEVPASPDIALAEPVPLVHMGRFNHEACATNPATGYIYLTEDRGDGLLYRFIPNHPDRLREGGRLQALVVMGRRSLDTRNWDKQHRTVGVGDTLPVTWLDLQDVDTREDSLRARGYKDGAARFARGEGMWMADGRVYFACTNGGPATCGQIWRLTPSEHEGRGRDAEEASPATLDLFLESPGPSVIENADNITVAPWGDLIVCEDGTGDQFLLGVTPNGTVYKLARNAISNRELAGAAFSPDGSTLFLNIQHSGITAAIRGPWKSRAP